MGFLRDYFLFLLKVVTAVIFLIIIFSIPFQMKKEFDAGKFSHPLTVISLSEEYEELKEIMQEELGIENKESSQPISENQGKTFIINFDGDIYPTQIDSLKQEVNAILSVANATDKVVLNLESGGGTIDGYGLAASELQRLKARGLHLTVLVDRVAASGGYMMASVGDEIIAAPFSYIGSIGVLAQLPNFHQLLEDNGIKYEQLTSGKYKRTITMFGKNTDEGRAKMQADIDAMHTNFKELIKNNRPNLNIEKVATGEYWLASQALELGLVDKIMTSEDYLTSLHAQGEELYLVEYSEKVDFWESIKGNLHTAINSFSVMMRGGIFN